MGAFIESLPKNTGARGPGGAPDNQAKYAAAVLNAVQNQTYDPIKWAHITLTDGTTTIKLAVFAKPMTFEGVYLPAGAGLLQQIADTLGCSMLTPKIQDAMYAQAPTRILPWLDFDNNRMATIEWFKRSTVGLNKLLVKANYQGGLVMGMGKPFQLDNELQHHTSENYGLYVPASMCPGGKYGGVSAPPTLTLPANQVRCLQGFGGWAHGLDQSDYSELISLVSRNCLVNNQLRDLVDVIRDTQLSALVSHNGPLKIVRQPGVAITACRIPPPSIGEGVGTPGDYGTDGKTACPLQLTGLPDADVEPAPPAPLPKAVPTAMLQSNDTTAIEVVAAVAGIGAAAFGAAWLLRRWRARRATR